MEILRKKIKIKNVIGVGRISSCMELYVALPATVLREAHLRQLRDHLLVLEHLDPGVYILHFILQRKLQLSSRVSASLLAGGGQCWGLGVCACRGPGGPT